MNEIEKKLVNLKNLLKGLKSVVVALSGGVDSSFLTAVTAEVLNKNAVAVTGVSPSLSKRELKDAKTVAELVRIEHILVDSNEILSEDYRKNPVDRCYFCKSELFKILKKIAMERSINAVIDGYSFDDIGDYRPGRKAGIEMGVRSPLLECNLKKDEIRQLSKRYNLITWNKPSSPCLASRIAYGTEITEEILHNVEKAEEILHSFGFDVVRARFHGDILRIEIPSSEINKFIDENLRKEMLSELKKNVAFTFITLDLEGFRSGSLNTMILKDKKKK